MIIINIPATRHTYAASISLSWRSIAGSVLIEPGRAWVFMLALGHRHLAFDQHGMLDSKGHRGVRGIVRYSGEV